MDKPSWVGDKPALDSQAQNLKVKLMQCTETESQGLSRVFRVVIPRMELQAKLDAKVNEVRSKTSLKGFRPGKAPPAHIKKIYGQGLLREIVETEVERSMRDTLQEAKVRAASEPHPHLESDLGSVLRGESDLAFHFHLEVMPEFEPIEVEGLELERWVAPADEAQLAEAEAALLKAQRDWQDKDGPAEEGDAVTIDFLGKIDGEAFEGGTAEDARVVIGAKQFIPGFEEGLAGLSAGDEKTVEATFPEDYPAAHLAGKTAQFEVAVKAVQRGVEPSLDDEFAQKLGLESAEAVRQALKRQIEAEHQRQSRLRLKRALFDKLDVAHGFALPEGMVQAEFGQIWSQIEADRAQGRLDAEDAEKSEDDLRADYRRISERRVRLGLVLAEIGRRNNVQVTEQELTTALAAQARQYPGREREVFEYFQKNAGALAQIRAPIYEDKIVDFIVELAKVQERIVSREELFAELDEG